MSSKAVTPIADPINLVLGAGAVYFNYGEVDETPIGATQGGSVFNANREFREVEQDGIYGPVKGLKRKNRIAPTLTVKAMELFKDNFIKFFAGMDVDDTSLEYTEIKERLNIEDTDYIKNVAFVGQNYNEEDVVIILDNVLGDGNIQLAIEREKEIVPEVIFSAHFDPAAPTVVPYKIRFPKTGA
jgi:hypothetical protein